MHWKTKARIFRFLSALPLGAQLHYLLQRHVTREWPRRPGHLDELLVAATRLLADAKARADVEHSHFVEIGAGRDMAVAVALRLMGVRRITCIDVDRLARVDLVGHAARHMAARLGVPAPSLQSWEDIQGFGIDYVAPAGLASVRLPDASVDCFYSVDTLEHIPRPALETILVEVRRILKPAGLTINFIDYGDHYARGDPALQFNFLTFSDEAWEPYNSKFQYVNRLRHSEFLALFARAGLHASTVEPHVEAPQAEVVRRLDPRFRRFSMEDLFTLRAKIVAVPSAG